MATMTMTLPLTTTITSSSSSSIKTMISIPAKPCCPNCGLSLPTPPTTTPPPPPEDAPPALLEAQKQIEDLQAQVRLLTQKATAAVDRWADYEDELSKLRAASAPSTADETSASNNDNNNNRPVTPNPSIPTSSPRSSFLSAGTSRISQLLSRKSTPNLAAPQTQNLSPPLSNSTSNALPLHSPGLASPLAPPQPSTPSTPSTDDLLSALTREKRLREAAETKVSDTSREVEELSVSLFEQANEMVATERRARAKLEERVTVLERRDVEKRDRLERLEGAMGRLERVRVLLGE